MLRLLNRPLPKNSDASPFTPVAFLGGLPVEVEFFEASPTHV